jgi:AraC family transcriptional regulator of adaptative response/methylated-DNA-[protein]-cysteine methyltransferase
MGQTRSYSEIAHELGNPKGARAVARACAENPAAVVIPCHRVIEKSGALGGYGGGVSRKRALLEREGASFSPPRAEPA